MSLLERFIIFLLSQKNRPSFSTVKNYKADIGQFISWFEKEFSSPFDASRITLQILDQYRKNRNLSPGSIKRHISSLRKFFHFLKFEGIIPQSPLEKKTMSAEALAKADPWRLINFKSFLYEYKKSNLTIKNYIIDIKNFFAWFSQVSLTKYSWDTTEKNLLDKINFSVVEEYKQRLIDFNFSPRTVNRKLSSLRNYIAWAQNQGIIRSSHPEFISGSPANMQASLQSNEMLNQVQHDTEKATSSFPPLRLIQKAINGANFLIDNLFILPLAKTIENTQYLFWKAKGKKIFKKNVIPNSPALLNIKREFYAPLDISLRFFPVHKKIWHHLRHSRPNWYKKYHSYSITHYFHFSILIILSCAVGFGMYDVFFANPQKQNTTFASIPSTLPRVLSFQGRLTDSQNNPIASLTDVLFSIYNDENASGATSLWQEINAVKPDAKGVFSTFLGKNTPIPDSLFSRNSELFLGITIGNSPELIPRQKLATVAFASNSETLQGLKPITNTTETSNVVLALDSVGNLSIVGSKTHTFQTIGGQFILSGTILSLTTIQGSNGRVEIVPDGIGKIDLSKPIQNSTNNNNLLSAIGSVEFDDTVAILATTSAQSAFYINQDSTGPLLSASVSGIAKFTLENDGTGMFAGDVGIDGGNLTSSNPTFNLLNSNVAALNIGGAATTINFGTPSGTINFKSNVIVKNDFSLSALTSNGGILYTNGSGKIFQVSAGSSSDCLMGGTTPSFFPCSKIFNQVSSVGIGTTAPLFKLDIQDFQDATAAAQIFNTSTNIDADGLIVKLGNTASTVANTNRFISFETSGIGIVGSIRGNATGVQYQTNGIADFAEYLKKDQNQIIEYGAVVCLEDNGLVIACDNNTNKIIGVASERPAFLGGENLGSGSIAVGLVGQVETLVSIANGEIKAGDALTAFDIPGVAVKATKAGQIIGKALEDLDILDESRVVGFYDPDNKEYRNKADFPDIPIRSNIIKVVKIYTLVNVSWYDPGAYLANNGDLVIHKTGSNGYSVSNAQNQTITDIAGFFEVASANIKTGFLNASEVITSSLIVTTDNMVVNGQNLKDYIAGVVDELGIKNQELGIVSPVVRTDRLSTDVISPLAKDSSISISLHDSKFIIHDSANASGSAVATIDDQGSASFSGTLISENLEINNDASISGTLRAGNIVAESIEGLEAKISTQLAFVPDLSAKTAQFSQGLMVFGLTGLSDLSVAGQLSIGKTLFVTGNSIEALGANLSLQSLRLGGLSFMGDLVYIDTEGNLKVKGDVSVNGKLAVNIISPLPTSDLVINNSSGSSVLSINQKGDIVASGSGTFSKLNFSLVHPASAISQTELIASSSAGIANINSYQNEVTVKNSLVTDTSIIYITPVGTPSAQSPFLIRQLPNSFTVGVESPTSNPIPFNWLIVN